MDYEYVDDEYEDGCEYVDGECVDDSEYEDDDCVEAFTAAGLSRGWLSASGRQSCRSRAITQQNDT